MQRQARRWRGQRGARLLDQVDARLEGRAQVGGHLGTRGIEVDDEVAIDNAEPWLARSRKVVNRMTTLLRKKE